MRILRICSIFLPQNQASILDAKSLFLARKHASWAPPREMKSFPSTETIFHSPKCKKYAFAGFSKFDTAPACVKTKVGR